MAKELHKFTEEDLYKVGKCAGIGLPQDRIASLFRLNKNELLRVFKEQPEVRDAYDYGLANAEAKVATVAYDRASSGEDSRMTMFWLKCRMGWKETTVVESKTTTIEDLVHGASEEADNVLDINKKAK
jgi:hypothetical protein